MSGEAGGGREVGGEIERRAKQPAVNVGNQSRALLYLCTRAPPP